MTTTPPRLFGQPSGPPPRPYGQPSAPPARPYGQPPPLRIDDTVLVPMPVEYLAPPLGAPPPPGRTVPAGVDQDRERLNVSVRNQAIDRMEDLNRNHARLAFDAKGAAICPHALAFLYLDAPISETKPDGTGGWRKVVAAARVVPDTDDVRELPTLLDRLATLALQRYVPTAGGFDPAVQMTQPQLRDRTSGHAEYIGIGVSTLDTPGLPWEQAFAAAHDTDDLGGRMYVLLSDFTAILVDRPPPRIGRRQLAVHSTGNLHFPDAMFHRPFIGHHNVSTMPSDGEVWELMDHLHQIVYQQDPRPTL